MSVQLKEPLDTWLPKIIAQEVSKRSGQYVTAEEFNGLFNLCISQGNHNARAITAIVERMIEGLSAYEIAVENGFSGDEQAWLDSLVGPQGIQGEQGIQGIQGERGSSAVHVGTEPPTDPDIVVWLDQESTEVDTLVSKAELDDRLGRSYYTIDDVDTMFMYELYRTTVPGSKYSTVDRIDVEYADIHAHTGGGQFYRREIRFEVEHPTLLGAYHYLEGYKVDADYGFQIDRAVTSTSLRTMFRICTSGIWGEWMLLPGPSDVTPVVKVLTLSSYFTRNTAHRCIATLTGKKVTINFYGVVATAMSSGTTYTAFTLPTELKPNLTVYGTLTAITATTNANAANVICQVTNTGEVKITPSSSLSVTTHAVVGTLTYDLY